MRNVILVAVFLIITLYGVDMADHELTTKLKASPSFPVECKEVKTTETLNYCFGLYGAQMIACKDDPTAAQCENFKNLQGCIYDMMQRNWIEEDCRKNFTDSFPQDKESLPGTTCETKLYTNPNGTCAFKESMMPALERFNSGSTCNGTHKTVECIDYDTLEKSDRCGPNRNESSKVIQCDLLSDFAERIKMLLPLPCLAIETTNALTFCIASKALNLGSCRNNSPNAVQCEALDDIISCLLDQVEKKKVEDICVPFVRRALTAGQKFEGTDCTFASYSIKCVKKPDLNFNGRYRFIKDGECVKSEITEKCVDILTVPRQSMAKCNGTQTERIVDCTVVPSKASVLFGLAEIIALFAFLALFRA